MWRLAAKKKVGFSALHIALRTCRLLQWLDVNHLSPSCQPRRRRRSGFTQETRPLKQSMKAAVSLRAQWYLVASINFDHYLHIDGLHMRPAYATTSSKRRVNVNLLNDFLSAVLLYRFLVTALPENNENRTKCRHRLHRSIIEDIYLVWS
ncbi:hypothetical protein ARMSODRAFT_682031 [Armillaria solidipes]|uniref:Uncharacterized protein n=1 Tax=Armillaria solidipes TaxID=1076256 RepID=A0A2H3B4I9_9AGAR|nr:hypothetical protein ARMSODRAFT_682031 [Armillaria solidipes]